MCVCVCVREREREREREERESYCILKQYYNTMRRMTYIKKHMATLKN